ncbi:MAG: DUF6498-containing protein [Elusimicrobia bacterium]|nr:DUF6498-containing protein [Elusimicrobiota bacterium]
MLIPRRVSSYTLIASNLVPIVMAPHDAAGIQEILAFYWTESVILGFFNILKILFASASDKYPEPVTFKMLNSRDCDVLAALGSNMGFFGKLFIAIFFTFPFLMYLGLYGVFLVGFFIDSAWLPLILKIKWWLLGLFISHGASFLLDYLASSEFRRTRSENLLEPLFSRLMITNLALLAVAGIFNSLGVWLIMIAFVIVKVVKELRYEAVCLLQADPGNIYRVFVFFENEDLLKKKFKLAGP